MRRLLVLLSLLLAGTLGAQEGSGPPRLPRGADPNDWRSHYDAGVAQLPRFPKDAAWHFYWASRLSPESAEPVYASWVALLLQKPWLLEREWKPGSSQAALLASIDSVLYRALEIDPLTPRNYEAYVLDAMPGRWGSDDLSQGYLAYAQARYDRATQVLARVRKGPKVRAARRYRALAFWAQERYDSAAVELDSLVAIATRENRTQLTPVYETSAVARYGVGVARLKLGDAAGAREALVQALGEDVTFAAAHVALARTAARLGDTAEVLREWQQALELRPFSGAVRGEYALALDKAGRRDEALVEYERAIALEPYWSGPYFNMAQLLDRMGRRDEAQARYAQFLERAPQAYAAQVAHARRRIGAP